MPFLFGYCIKVQQNLVLESYMWRAPSEKLLTLARPNHIHDFPLDKQTQAWEVSEGSDIREKAFCFFSLQSWPKHHKSPSCASRCHQSLQSGFWLWSRNSWPDSPMPPSRRTWASTAWFRSVAKKQNLRGWVSLESRSRRGEGGKQKSK